MDSYQVNPNKGNRRYIVKITYEDSLTKVFHDKDTAIIHARDKMLEISEKSNVSSTIYEWTDDNKWKIIWHECGYKENQ
jgi:hypothetical protein